MKIKQHFQLLLIACFLGLSSQVLALKKLSREQVYELAAKAVVLIYSPVGNTYTFGAGAIIDGRGYVITNNHVVAENQWVRVYFKPINKVIPAEIRVFMSENRHFDGEVIKKDTYYDLALIKIKNPPPNLPIISIGDSDLVKTGQDVIAIGHPKGLPWTLTKGAISAIRVNALQTDTPIHPGNSGGPLLNEFGQLIGINSYVKLGTETLCFARPSSLVTDFIKYQIEKEKIPVAVKLSNYYDPVNQFSIQYPAGWEKSPPQQKMLVSFVGKIQDSGFASFNILKIQTAFSLPDTVKENIQKFQRTRSDFRIIKEEYFTYKGYRAAFLILDFSYRDKTIRMTHFYIKRKQLTYLIRYVSTRRDYKEYHPVFSKIAMSFSLYRKGKPEVYAEEEELRTPKDTMLTLIKNTMDKDFETALTCFDLRAKNPQAVRTYLQYKFYFKIRVGVRVGQIQFIDNKAHVDIYYTVSKFKEDKETKILQKIGDQWKIVGPM